MTDDVARAHQASSFGAAADQYARGRPPYPPEAVDWLVPGHARRVLDLGAGTGKLTASLVDRGLDVTAVEPSTEMRAQLSEQLPRVPALEGSAEAIPVPAASTDAVLVAQAWHWVDPGRALPEVARVLVDGGRLSLVWNVRDERAAWVAALSDLLVRSGEDLAAAAAGVRHVGESVPDLGTLFGPVETFEVSWVHRLTPQALVDMMTSRSYVITAPVAQRQRLVQAVERLLATHPDLRGRTWIDLPYRTFSYRATKR